MHQYKEDIFVLKNDSYRNYQHVKKKSFFKSTRMQMRVRFRRSFFEKKRQFPIKNHSKISCKLYATRIPKIIDNNPEKPPIFFKNRVNYAITFNNDMSRPPVYYG